MAASHHPTNKTESYKPSAHLVTFSVANDETIALTSLSPPPPRISWDRAATAWNAICKSAPMFRRTAPDPGLAGQELGTLKLSKNKTWALA